MLSFEHISFDYEPYPIGIARPALDSGAYADMVANFPDFTTMDERTRLGLKFDLSERRNRRLYDDFVGAHPVWRDLRAYVQKGSFIDDTLAMLRSHRLDLGIRNASFFDRLRLGLKNLMKRRPLPAIPTLTARFDFSAMPVTGGHIRPHTDTPEKIVTMVVPILEPDEWDPSYGGGTSVVLPKDRTNLFNQVNSYLDFDQVDELRTYAFEPNQALVFIKTFNSWHAVLPMTGNDPNKLRRSLTINIEAI